MVRSVDMEATKVMVVKNMEKLAQRKRIQNWTHITLQQIEQDGQLEFSPFFFKMLAICRLPWKYSIPQSDGCKHQ